MNIEIRKLTPDLVENYVTFFDTTPHNEKYNIKCYCVWWCSDDSEGKSFSTKKQDEIMPSIASEETAYRAISPIVTIKWWVGATLIRNQTA